MRMRLASVVLVVTLAFVTFGQGTLTVRSSSDVQNMDPARLNATLDDSLARNIYSGLVRYGPHGFDTVVPDLAQDWNISEDGLTYTFHLRPDARFHHGYGRVTAQDVVFSLMRHKDPAVASVHLGDAAIIDDVQALDDDTVQITLTQPFPGFLTEYLAYRPGYIVSERAMEDLGGAFGTNPVGSGPFEWANYVPNSQITLRPFSDYYGDTGTLSEVRVVYIKEDALFQIALQNGDVDVGYVHEADIQQSLLNNTSLKTVSAPAAQTMYLMLNVTRPPLDDVRVRRALEYATNKDQLVGFVLNGLGAPTDTLPNPYVFGYLDEVKYHYDPDQARELLAEAGYPNGFDISIMVRPQQLEAEQATALQSMWREVGVNVTIIGPIESAQASERRTAGNFEITTVARMRLGPDQYFTPQYHSKSIPTSNSSRYSNPEMDRLIDEAKAELNDDRRRELYYEIQRLAQDELPVIPLYNPLLVVAMRPEVNGVRIPGSESFLFSEISVGQP